MTRNTKLFCKKLAVKAARSVPCTQSGQSREKIAVNSILRRVRVFVGYAAGGARRVGRANRGGAVERSRAAGDTRGVSGSAGCGAHTRKCDTWVSYDANADGTRLGVTLRRPATERTEANNKAVSFAARPGRSISHANGIVRYADGCVGLHYEGRLDA
jgi:hypothetical protein